MGLPLRREYEIEVPAWTEEPAWTFPEPAREPVPEPVETPEEVPA